MKPDDLFARDVEWADLRRFAGSETSAIAIVYGRRRQGKSWLLRRIVADVGGIYHMALEHDRRAALRRFATNVAEATGMAGVALRMDDWEQALETAADLLARSGQHVLVIDEYPYLVEHSPELASVLQAFYDERVNNPNLPQLRIILCGSAITVMEQLLSGQSPLRGRTQVELRIQPFRFRTSASFWGVGDPEVAFQLDAILGGTPGYRTLAGLPPPDTVDALALWLSRTVLNPASALFTEAEYLLREDPRIQQRSVYFAILTAIAQGRSTQTEIGGAIGRDRTSLAHPLDVLVTAGFVRRSRDVRKARGSTYRIADPIVRFHHLITRPRLSQFEEREFEQAWVGSMPTFRSQILGPHFEHLARSFTRHVASVTTTGGAVGEVGSTVMTDADARARHFVDVVGLAAGARSGRKTAPVVCLGEAKASDRPRTTADLSRLDRIRAVMASDGADCHDAMLLLFGRSGFDPALHQAAAERGDVELIDLDRLYHGE